VFAEVKVEAVVEVEVVGGEGGHQRTVAGQRRERGYEEGR